MAQVKQREKVALRREKGALHQRKLSYQVVKGTKSPKTKCFEENGAVQNAIKNRTTKNWVEEDLSKFPIKTPPTKHQCGETLRDLEPFTTCLPLWVKSSRQSRCPVSPTQELIVCILRRQSRPIYRVLETTEPERRKARQKKTDEKVPKKLRKFSPQKS